MAPQRPEDGYVRMPEHEFEAILVRAAEEGTKRALAGVGLEGDEAALDIRDLRSMLDLLRLVRRTAVHTVVRVLRCSGFLVHLGSLVAAMNQKSSVTKTSKLSHRR